MSSAATYDRSKTLATWIAVIGGGLGLHRFYLHSLRDAWGWAYPLPTLLGLYGVQRAREIGLDDPCSWLLIPLLGFALAAAMLSAIVYGLTPDEKWAARYNPGRPAQRTGWAPVLGVIVALLLGAGVLMATLAFSAQRWFEYQVDEGRKISR
jgi:hypothetical protein